MEDWQFEELKKLLETEVKELEPGKRIYTSTSTYGTGFYHMIDKRYDSVQIEQVDVDEKWNKRVNIYQDEQAALIKTLLLWYLEEHKPKEKVEDSSDDALGDLDDHPF